MMVAVTHGVVVVGKVQLLSFYPVRLRCLSVLLFIACFLPILCEPTNHYLPPTTSDAAATTTPYPLLSVVRPFLPFFQSALRSVGLQGPPAHGSAVVAPVAPPTADGRAGLMRSVVYGVTNAMPDGSEQTAADRRETWKGLYSMFSSFVSSNDDSNQTIFPAQSGSMEARRLISLPDIPELPALPLKLSLGTWLPDWSLMNEDTADQLPSLLYYLSMLFMQESLLFNAKEVFRGPAVPIGAQETETVTLKDVGIITEPGFGSKSNRYVFKLLEFKGKVYASTLNFKTREGLDGFFLGLPFFSEGGEIWAGEQTGGVGGPWTWENSVKDGLGSSSNGGVRNMVAYGEFIYAVTLNHVLGFELWRSRDGVKWTAEVRLGLGNRFNTSGRGVTVWKDHLYIGVENRSTGAQLWRRKLTADGDWIEDSRWEVIAHGTGQGGLLTNFWYSDFVEFKGNLYVGTMNFLGLEIWRISEDSGGGPDDIELKRVYKGSSSEQGRGISQMRVFKGTTLFVGTMFRMPKGAALLSSTDGENFKTHEPPVLIPGFVEEKHYIYLWSMIEYNGRMYVSANEWTTERQGFVLFSFADPEDVWTVETATAFGYAPLYYGIRSMNQYNGQLLMGSAGVDPCVVFSAVGTPP
eukprot:GHVS01004007.1.p1 GENE.GHVS01004007.1~~GHVS01004007.1.p1  ORF type:complete len:635 (-),score=101.90 GHVS01004007.1:439-2343(-)